MNRKPRPTKSPYQIKEEHKVFAGRQKKTQNTKKYKKQKLNSQQKRKITARGKKPLSEPNKRKHTAKAIQSKHQTTTTAAAATIATKILQAKKILKSRVQRGH